MNPIRIVANIIPHRLVFMAAILALASSLSAQRYKVGDIVEDFTLTDRATGLPVSLNEFEGKIVFLEWFAHWCPYCKAAAEQIKPGIVDYYNQRNGNTDGVPVLHVGINLQADAEVFTQQFINRYGLGQVLNDLDASLANRFQSFGQPIFAIINGVGNSPSHEQWELIYSRLGYGDLEHPIDTFRSAIDSVQAAAATEAPAILSNPTAQRLATGSTLELTVEASGDALSYQWQHDGANLAGQTSATLSIQNVEPSDTGSYSVTISNEGGSVSTPPVQVDVLLSLDDYLESAGLAESDRDHAADPDFDGFNNAFEYLAQTDPNDASQKPDATFGFSHQNGVPVLVIQFEPSSDALNVKLEAHFWSAPIAAGSAVIPLALDAPIEIVQPIPTNAKTYLGRLQATPSPM